MTAKCWGCAVGAGAIPGASFTRGDPVGCCIFCHALMCGHHGDRDPGPPRFECVLCTPALLVASAAAMSRQAANSPDERNALLELEGFGRTDVESSRVRYRSVDDFGVAHPRYRSILLNDLKNTNWHAVAPTLAATPIQRVVQRMSSEALSLMGAAKLLMNRLELPATEFSPTLLDALSAIGA